MTKSLLSCSGYLAIALVPALLIASLSALSVTAQTNQEYPQEYSQNYLQECQDTAIAEGLPDIEAESLCSCTLKEFQQKYTLDEFKDLNKRSETDVAASDALIEVGEFCFEEILFE